MPRICEVCGREEETENEQRPYRILDVCSDCTDNLIHPASLQNEENPGIS